MAEQEPLRKLYDVLNTEQLYTKSFDEFKTKYSTEEEVSKMFNIISERQLYTKDLNSFKSQYFPDLGKQTEVSGQGSAGTSQTSGQQSSSSAEPSSDVIEMGSGVNPYTAQADIDTLLSSDPTRQVGRYVNLGGERGISYLDPTDGEVYNYLPTTEVTYTVPFRQQLSNVFHNAKQQLLGFDDRLSLVAADTWEKILGKELAADFYGWSDRDIDEVRREAYAELQALDESMQFVAPIGGSIAEGDFLGAMAGIINAATSMGTTALVSVPTFGAGLYTEMVGQGLYDYNTTKAEDLGLTVEELYAQGKADYALPATVGIIGGASEKFGYKGVTKAFMSALNSPVGKVIARTSIESNKEGLTEWFQEGLSALNTEMAKEGATMEDGLRAMGQAMTSQQGLEAYLGGVFGGLSAAGVGSTVRSINRKVTDVNKKKKIEKTAKAIAALNEELSNTDLNPITREVLEQNRESLQGEVIQDIKDASVEYEALSPEQKSEIETLENRREELETAIEDPNVSEATKTALQAQIEDLDNQITEVALPGRRPTPIEGETFELSRLPEALNTPDSLEQIEADSRRIGEEFADGTIDEATWTLANQQIGRREAILNQTIQETSAVDSAEQQGGLSQNNAPSTQDFFTAVVEGTDPRFIPQKPYETEVNYTAEQQVYEDAVSNKRGNFDEHIAASIPLYRETQTRKGAGIVGVLKGRENPVVLDIGGSEGNLGKTITELTGVRTVNLEPNDAMASRHESNPVRGAEVVREAFYEGFDEIPAHVPTEKFDVVNESMVFQFITPERQQFIDHVADNYLKEDGLFLTEEKLKTDEQLYLDNEQQKDTQHKSKYFTSEQLAQKTDQVLTGMDTNQADVREYADALKRRFRHVGLYWNSGNFYGIAATNDKSTFDAFMQSVGDTTTPYTKVPLGEITDTSTIPSSQIANSEQISQELSTPTFFETVTDSESRKTRIEQLKQRLSDNLEADQNLGTFQDNRARAKRDIDFLRDLTELAILSIADGTVKTAEAFRNLAKGVGDFGDNVLNRAYTAATQSVEEYQTWARPKEATDARVGELLTRMQDLDVDRAPAKTKIRAKQVKELTGGGIKGKVDLTNRQALREQIKTLNRGIRDGKAQIAESRKAITDFIKDMKDQGLFRGKVRGSTVTTLLNRVNRANTPAALSNALAYAEKASEIIDYDQKRAKAENNKKRVKRASKGRGMPQDLKAVMTDISNINLTYVDNIEQFNDMTDRLLDAVKGMGIDGIWTEDFVKLKESVDKKIKQAKESRLRDELVNAGMDQDFVDGLNTLDQLMEALATLPEGSKAKSSESLRSIRERALQQTLPMIEEMDRTGFTDKQNDVIDALLGLDISKISDSVLPSVVIAAKNIAVNGSFLGTGPIEVEYKFQQRTSNTKDADVIKKTVASPSKWMAEARGKIGSVLIQIDSILKNRDAVGVFMRMTGFGDYISKYNIFVNRFNTEVRDNIAEVQRKYSKDLKDPLQRVILGAYADLNNSKKSWDDSKRAEEFTARKEAIKESYKRMVEFAKRTPRGWGRDNKNYIELYRKLVDQLDSFNSAEDIWNSLNKGHQELYKVSREFYDRMIPEVKQNAEIDNNTIFDNEWQGTYFPRSYMPLDTKVRRQEQINATQTSILDQMAEGNTFNTTSTHVTGTEVSGAKRARTLTGSELPLNTHIDLDFMTNFLRESKKMLYDVETQAERRYSARVMSSPELLEIFGDVDALDIFRNAMIQKMEKDLIAASSRGMKSAIRSISDEVYGLNVNLALGGVEQIVKQAIPQMVDTQVRLGKNHGLLFTGMYMYANEGDFGHLMEGSSVRHRNVRNVEVRDNALSQKEISYIKKIVDSQLGKLGKKGKEIRDFVTMGPLTLGDDFAAKSSWYAHYVDYLKRNNLLKFTPDGKMDLAEVNTDARSYADFQTDLSNNISDPAMKARLFSGTTGSVIRAVYPFISFAVNAKLELINNLTRLVEGESYTVDQKMAIGRNISANITNILIYGLIGAVIRDQMVKISGAVIADLVARFGDLDEEEEDKLLTILEEKTSELREANKRNSQEYLIKDLLFGGIAEQFTEPFYDLGSKLYYSAKGDEEALEELNKRGKSSDPWDLAFEAMGGYGILPRTGRRFYTSFREWHLTDAEWRVRKYGIEDEMGEALVVPLDKEGIERPRFSRYAFGLSTIAHGAALFTGASWQSVSGTVQRVQRLAKMAEQELHGRDAGKLKEIESLKTVTVGSEKIELTEEQFERAKEIRKAVVSRIMLAEVNPVLTTLKEEVGLELPEISRDELGLKAGERVAIETIRKIATSYAKIAIILEDNLLEGLEEKERAKAEKALRSHQEAVEAYIEAHNLGKTTPEEYEKRRVKK